eukprot:SM000256S08666  [mRNA]  locus=s256:90788:92917:+ [translate_table: standard]
MAPAAAAAAGAAVRGGGHEPVRLLSAPHPTPSTRLAVSRRAQRQRFGSSSSRRAAAPCRAQQAGSSYLNVTGFPFPLSPFLERQTLRYELQQGVMWGFEQEQGLGFSSVTTNVRMTVVRLASGGLWVHAPIAPTRQCLQAGAATLGGAVGQLLSELGADVEHIVLPTFAYEHKVFVGPFSRKFPRAAVWVAPSQWSWPLNLPPAFFGIFPRGILRSSGDSSAPPPPWADEIEQKVFKSPEVGAFPLPHQDVDLAPVSHPLIDMKLMHVELKHLWAAPGIGPYVEVAFFHKATRTLLVTDAVVLVPPEAPKVVRPQNLLAAAQNGLAVQILSKGKEVSTVPVPDSPVARRRGWQRMVLQILFFGPANLLEPEESFRKVSNRLIVSPVVKTLVFSKVPEQAKAWVESIAQDWNFKRIIPAHFAAPINATPSDFRAAFSFLDELLVENASLQPSSRWLLPLTWLSTWLARSKFAVSPDDMKTLTALDNFLVKVGAVRKTTSNRLR